MQGYLQKYSFKELQNKFQNTVKTNCIINKKTKRDPFKQHNDHWTKNYLNETEDSETKNNSSMMHHLLKDFAPVNISSILDMSNNTMGSKLKEKKESFFSKIKRKRKRKKQSKEDKEIQKMKERVSLLLGDVSQLLSRGKKKKKKRKRVNVEKLMRDFKRNMPAEVFSENFNLPVFFRSFKFDERSYPHTMVLLLEYVDKAVVATSFLIWEKKDCLVQLMTKIMGVSRSLTSGRECLGLIRVQFDSFVQNKAAGFIGRRNAQMKRMRLEVYLEHLEWLKTMRGKLGKLMVYIARGRTEGLFELYEETRKLYEKKVFEDLAEQRMLTKYSSAVANKHLGRDPAKRFSFNKSMAEMPSQVRELKKVHTLTPKDLFPGDQTRTPKKRGIRSTLDEQDSEQELSGHDLITPEKIALRRFSRSYSQRCKMMAFKKRYQEKLSVIRKKISILLEIKFRFAFKEFLVLDIGESVPLREKPEFLKVLLRGKSQNKINTKEAWEKYSDSRDLWKSDLKHLPTNVHFLKRVSQNNAALIRILKDPATFMEEGLGLSFDQTILTNEESTSDVEIETEPETETETETDSQSQAAKTPDSRPGQGTLHSKNMKTDDHALAITAMFLEVNQITTFQMRSFCDELSELADKLSRQLKISLMKSFLNAPMEEMAKFTTAPRVRLKLVSDYFQIQWNFFLRFFVLSKLHLFGIAHVSQTKGVRLNEPYIAKLIHDFYFILNAHMARLMMGVQDLIAALFSNDLTINEVLGLKQFFMTLYQITSLHVYTPSGFGLPRDVFGEQELAEIKMAEKKLIHQVFLDYLWKIELWVIKSYAMSKLRGLRVFVEKEDWKDLNVSFDIVDRLGFILNQNLFMGRHQGKLKQFPIKTQNTLVIIDQKHFRLSSSIMEFIKSLFGLMKISDMIQNNIEIETLILNLFQTYTNTIQHSVYSELMTHISALNKSSNSMSNTSSENIEKKKKQTFKNFFKKLKIDKKKKKKKEETIPTETENREEVNRIFEICRQIIAILNKLQIVNFLYERVLALGVLQANKQSETVRREIKALCGDMENNLYSVASSLIGHYGEKVAAKQIDSMTENYIVPSMETCGLLNILGQIYKEIWHSFGSKDYRYYLEEFNTMVHEKYLQQLQKLRASAPEHIKIL